MATSLILVEDDFQAIKDGYHLDVWKDIVDSLVHNGHIRTGEEEEVHSIVVQVTHVNK